MYRWSLLVLLFGCVALGAATSSDEELISELDVDDQSLARSLIATVNMYDEPEDDDDENPGFERGIKERVTAECDCQGNNNCGCCGRIQVIGSSRLKLCGNVSVVPSEYAFQVGMRVGKMYSYKTKISAKKLERVCDRLPLFLSSVKLCLKSTMEQLGDENSFKSCMLIDVQVGSKVITTFKFKCLRYENNVLAFEGRSEEETGAIANIKTPNPIKTVIDLIKSDKDKKGGDDNDNTVDE